MGPGISEVDPGVKVGDLVWVRDERNKRPLSVGRALVDAESMARKEKGKAVSAMHHVGDKLWQLDEPKEKEPEAGSDEGEGEEE
jgi:predicted ribosome-associated RNA-binding protein Tma20